MPLPDKDVIIDVANVSPFLRDKHLEFLLNACKKDEELSKDFIWIEPIKLSGAYWVLTALSLMKKLDSINKEEFVEFLLSCVDKESGGLCASTGHDPHLLHTLSGVQCACILDVLDQLPVNDIVKYVAGLQLEDGSFMGDKWGEVDTRFSFCAVACLALLGRLDAINVRKAVDYVLKCQNFDGGFGSCPNAESHSGLIYCCVGLLSITGDLSKVDADQLGWWLSERQLPSGGLNGRPEKLPDVCYSWWVLSSMKILGRLNWINGSSLKTYMLACQDTDSGGFSDRPQDHSDPFHTLFGIAALALLGEENLEEINPTFCMPQFIINKMNLSPQVLNSP